MKNQAKEYDALENEIDGSIMVLKIKRWTKYKFQF
jgi:hypothetical protein